MAKKRNAYLLVGTKKGAFILSSDARRIEWLLSGPLLKGAEVNDVTMDTRDKPTLYACVNSYWRQAMTHDELKPFGLYVGTTSGHIFWSRDNGSS